jgi:hypothetical protein
MISGLGRISLLLALLTAAGCSKSDVVEVTGVATWEGQPMPSGEVVFLPADPKARPSAGLIKDGKFKFLSKTGKMRVEIDAARDTGKRDDRGNMIDELYIPAKYNRTSKLEAEVTQDGENHFEFALTK